MNSTQTLPDEYVQSGEVNLKKNKRLSILLNIVAFFVFIISIFLLSIFGTVVRAGTINISGSISASALLTTVHSLKIK